MNENIQQGQVKVSLEGFGGRSLVAVLERGDVEGKTFEQVINTLKVRPYSGADKNALAAI